MAIWEIILIGISLSMDAFSVAICKGLEMKKFCLKHGIIIALFFGIAQAVMPLIGYFVGFQFSSFITNFDHWIAFGLLAILGGKMIYDSFKKDCEKIDCCEEKLDFKQLFMMAITTSIDALAVGVSMAFLDASSPNSMPTIYLAAPLIGIVTFCMSFIGTGIGHKVGSKFKNKAQLIGGIALILVGTKILLEHLGVIAF